MIIKHYKLILFGILIFCLPTKSSATETELKISLKNSEEYFIELEDSPVIHFEKDSMFAQTSKLAVGIALADFNFYLFTDKESNQTKEEKNSQNYAYMDGDLFILTGSWANSKYRILDMHGHVYSVPAQNKENRLEFNFSKSPAGTYIIESCGLVFKYIKR